MTLKDAYLLPISYRRYMLERLVGSSEDDPKPLTTNEKRKYAQNIKSASQSKPIPPYLGSMRNK